MVHFLAASIHNWNMDTMLLHCTALAWDKQHIPAADYYYFILFFYLSAAGTMIMSANGFWQNEASLVLFRTSGVKG